MLTRIKARLHWSTVAWITLLWCFLMGEVTWANLIAGLLIGLAVVLSLPLPKMPIANLHISYRPLVSFLLRWLGSLFAACFKVAWLALRPAEPPKTAIIHAPMRVQNEMVLAFATMMYNLQPGGSVTDIDIANRTWTVHLLDADNEEDLARERENIAKMERDLITIFERTH